MQETWVWSLGLVDPLEKGKATHSSILAWRIPWTVYSMNCIVHGVTKSQTQLRDFTCFSAGYIFPTVTQYPLLLSPSFLYIFVSLIPHGGLPTQKQPIKYFPNQTWFQHMSVSGAYCWKQFLFHKVEETQKYKGLSDSRSSPPYKVLWVVQCTKVSGWESK